MHVDLAICNLNSDNIFQLTCFCDQIMTAEKTDSQYLCHLVQSWTFLHFYVDRLKQIDSYKICIL